MTGNKYDEISIKMKNNKNMSSTRNPNPYFSPFSSVKTWIILVCIQAAIPIIKGELGDTLEFGDTSHSPEHDLFAQIFRKYNKHIPPISFHGEIIRVFFELSLFNVLNFDVKNQQIRTNSEIIMKWQDHYLKWNPEEFNGTENMRIPSNILWRPDIIMQNTYYADYEGSLLTTNAILSYKGEVELISHGIFDSICIADVQYYPFDQQTCKLVFSSWTYDNKQIELLEGSTDLSKYKQNPEFFLENFWSIKSDSVNPCCQYPMSTITYYIQVQRRTIFSLFFFITPGILINICALMAFSLPTESGEKISLGINALLAMIVFLMAMTERLPPTEKLPLAGVYYGACMTMITLNIIFSVCVFNLDVAGLRGYSIPNTIKPAILHIAKIIAVKVPIFVRDTWEEDIDGKLTKVEPVSNYGNPVNILTVEAKKVNHETSDEDNDEKNYAYANFKDPFEKRALYALESMRNILSREENETYDNGLRKKTVEEWKFLSRVMDRLLFIVFFLASFIFNITILTSSPFRERFDYCPLGENMCEHLTYQEIIQLNAEMAYAADIIDNDGETHTAEGNY
ncbi:Neurotransmitter-gated ion-channel transmembrane region [Halocaridina rubra]|uniref:Neurotransmitter-gated ion-channel transmembrane region n=1 Tax=Halocaridina rubra TaxID=373956 RepID=A0AAN9A9E8_HALRR